MNIMNAAKSNGLPPEAFRRADAGRDETFYAQPRFVTHIDAGAIAAVTAVYREIFPEGGAVLDLMSSWVSHLPPEVAYSRVAGLGMNGEELAANPRLTEFAVQNLNENPVLLYGDAEFDGAGICVSIQYLTHPAAVLREAGRVLRPGAAIGITFSNRCFPTKAVAVWQAALQTGESGALAAHYLRQAGNWTDIEVRDCRPQKRGGDPLYAVIARRKAQA